MEKFRVLLIEDNRLLRDGMAAMFRKRRDFNLVAATENADEALLKAKDSDPDVILLDQCLRDQDSLRLAETVRKTLPKTKVIVMGLIAVKADVVKFVKAGVSGFILKDSTFDDCLKTIRSVVRGGKVLPPELTGSLFSTIVEDAGRNGKARPDDFRVTKREREIIDLISEGLSNKEIAQRLRVSVYTIKSHVHGILEKLALHSRLQVAAYAHGRAVRAPAKGI